MDPLLQFETQLTMIESSFKKTFSIPSFDKVREICSRNNDKDLEVRSCFPPSRWDIRAHHSRPQKCLSRQAIFVVVSLSGVRVDAQYFPALISTLGLRVNATAHGI